MKNSKLFVMAMLCAFLGVASCSKGAKDSQEAQESQEEQVSSRTPQEVYAKVQEYVQKWDLNEAETLEAIEIYGDFYEAITPECVEMVKQGIGVNDRYFLDIYVYVDETYPDITTLINKRIYPNIIGKKDLDDKISQYNDKFRQALEDAKNN